MFRRIWLLVIALVTVTTWVGLAVAKDAYKVGFSAALTGRGSGIYAPVKDAFDEVNRARQNKERVINDARGERNRQIPAARGKRDRAISEAEGYHERVVRTTTGRVDAYLAKLAEYEKAPEVTRTRLYLEAMEEILAQVDSKIVIDQSVEGILPLLNLGGTGPGSSGMGKGGVK